MKIAAPHAFAAPEQLRAMRLDLATRTKARQVNLGLLCRQNEDMLRDAAQRCDASARGAINRLLDAVTDDAPWTPAIGRDLRAAIRGLSVRIARLSHAPAAADAQAWLRDRLAEIAAQDAQVIALESALAAYWPEAARQIATEPAKRRRRG